MAGEDRDFWTVVDRHIDERVAEQVKIALANHRPRGAGAIALSAGGTAGSVIVASMIVPIVAPKVPFPVLLDEWHISANAVGSITMDVWVQRPGQPVGSAASIIGATFPALVAVQEATGSPVADGWRARYIEPGSVVMLFVTAADGVLQSATITLGGRCV